MKRSTYEGATVVYQYGCPHWADLGEPGMEQIRLAHRLRNEMVEIERQADETYQAAKREAPDFAAADDACEVARLEVRRLREQIKTERMQYRRTKPRAASRQALTAAGLLLKAAKARRTAVLAEVPPEIQAKFSAIWDGKKERVGKTLYRKWVAQGLGWATVGMVRDDMAAAMQKVIDRRKRGLPAELHFRGWRGDGTLSVQCMQQAGKPRRVEWEITGDHARHKVLRLRIGRARGLEPCRLELPFVYHRPLPCEPQDVTDVQITRRMVADRSRITIQFTCRVAKARPRTGSAALAVRIGWKQSPLGLLVARVASSEPLAAIPPDLAPLVRCETACSATVYLPPEYTWPLERAADVRRRRDEYLEEVRPVVVAAMGDPQVQTAANGDPSRWRSPARFVALCGRLPMGHALHSVLAPWQRRDRHLRQFECHERDQVIARRNDAYRKLAAWLMGQAGTLECAKLSSADYASLRRKAQVAEDSREERASRRQSQMAAPGLLRQMLEQAAQKHGIQVMHTAKGDLAHAGDD